MLGYIGIVSLDNKEIDKDLLNKVEGTSDRLQNKKKYRSRNLYYSSSQKSYDCYFDKSENKAFFLFGRIDNTEEIQGILKTKANGAGLIYFAYRRWGRKFANRLVGAFAIFVYDQRDKSLFALKDHIGMKPIFYSTQGSTLFFASEISLFKNLLRNSPRPNKRRIIHYLAYTCGLQKDTFFQDIFRIPAGTYMQFTLNGVSEYKYHKYEINQSRYDLKVVANDFYKILRTVIENISHGKKRIGSKLSGGLDSSTISALSLLHNKKEKTELYSVIYSFLNPEEFKLVDEKSYMKSFESHYKLRTNYLDFNDEALIDPYQYDSYDDEPNFIPNRYFDYQLLRYANSNEINFIFDGFDGDSVISYGNNRLYDLARTFQFNELLYEKKLLEQYGFSKKITIWKFIKKYFFKPLIPEYILKIYYKLNKNDPFDKDIEIFDVNVIANDELEDIKNKLNITYQSKKTSQEMHKSVYEWPMWELVLDLSFRDAAKYNIEEGFPFLDKRVMEYSLNVRPEHKMKNGITRLFLRESMKDILPEKIVKRSKKSNLSPAINRYFRQLKIEKRYMNELISDSSNIAGLVSKEKIRDIYKSQNEKDNMLLHRIITLYRWMKRNEFKW